MDDDVGRQFLIESLIVAVSIILIGHIVHWDAVTRTVGAGCAMSLVAAASLALAVLLNRCRQR